METVKPFYRALKSCAVIISIFLILTSFSGANRALAAAINFTDMASQKYDWARPFVEKMVLLGVVTGKSPDTFSPDDPVKRVEFITMIVRLMGLEEEAKNKALPANFPNASSIPQWARGYVAVAVEKGIISGDDYSNFRPDDATKRFEAAVFAVRAMGMEKDAQSIKNISLPFKDTNEIPLNSRTYVQLAVEKKILAGFDDGSFKPKENLTRAQSAKILNQIAEYMDLSGRIATGRVEKVVSDFLNYMDVRLENGTLATYFIGSDCGIYEKDEKGNLKAITLKDLVAGAKLRIIAEGNNAKYIEAFLNDVQQPTSFKTVTGILKSALTGYVVVENEETGNKETYSLDASVRVTKDGKVASLSQLASGDMVTLMLYGDRVFNIEAESPEKKVKGSVKSVSFLARNPVITLELDDGSVEDFEVEEGVEVKRDGKSAELGSIKSQDEVTLYLEYKKVTRIEAKSVKQNVSGVVKAVLISDVSKITVVDDEGEEYTFTVTSNSKITQDKKSIAVSDIKPNFYVEIEADGEEILKMEVTARQLLHVVRGTVKYLHTDIRVIVAEFKDDQGKTSTVAIYYTDDTLILKGNREVSVKKIADYIEEGDEIIAAGRYDRDIFYADVVMDLVTS